VSIFFRLHLRMPFGRRSLDAPRASGLTLPPLNRATGANIWDFHHPEDCEEEEDQATHREGATDPVTPTSDPLPSRVLLYGGVCVLKCRSTSIPEVTAPAKGRPLPVSWEEEDGVTPSTVGLPRLQSLSLRPPHIARNGRFFELASFGPAPLLSPRTPPNGRIASPTPIAPKPPPSSPNYFQPRWSLRNPGPIGPHRPTSHLPFQSPLSP